MVYRTRKRTYSSWNPRAIMSGVSTAAKVARLAYNVSRTRNTNRKRYTSGQGVTEQYDKKTIYRKKYMPKGKKIRWRRFKRKIYAISEKTLGSRTYVVNTQSELTKSTSGEQLVFDLSLYGFKSNSNRHNDLNELVTKESTSAPSVQAPVIVDLTTKFMFQSGILDLTVRNTSFNVEGASQVPIQIEMDVYEIMIGKDTDNTANDLNDITDLITKASNDTKQVGGGIVVDNELSLNQRGVTPWDIPIALSRYRIKILKKTKYFLGSNQTMTYQYRDPKRRVVTKQRVTERSGYSRPGWTKTILMLAKPVPGYELGTGDGKATVRLNVGTTRKYLYKIEGANQSRDFYIKNEDNN